MQMLCGKGSGDSQNTIRKEAGMLGLVLMWVALTACPAEAQVYSWMPYYTTSGPIYYTGGNVGIGTSSPTVPLDVLSSGTFAPAILTRDIPTSAPYPMVGWGPQSAIQIGLKGVGSNTQTTGPSFLFFADNTAGVKSFLGRLTAVWENPTAGSEAGAVIFTTRFGAADINATTERMRITGGGNVGIGTSTPQYRLAVNGTIGAKEVIVTNTGWPDYVFKPDYRLRPLGEVRAFIQKHHHLPDIPSEAEVKEQGVSLGDMQAKLLAKVEELTLHLIRQDEQNRELRQNLTKENQELRERLELLEKRAGTDRTPAVAK